MDNQEKESSTFKLVVYGTLKSGRGAYHSSTIIGKPKEVELKGYDMYSLGGFPGVIPGDHSIKAEVHEYPMHLLPSLDAYEGVPTLYQRHRIKVDGEFAFIYLFTNEEELRGEYALVEDGVW